MQEAEAAINAWADPDSKARLRIAVTETAPIDYGYPAKWGNAVGTTGHMIVAFDIIASTLQHPRVDTALFWCARQANGILNPKTSSYGALGRFPASRLKM